VLSVLLSIGVTVFAFDCSGSGKSEGKYVSLGYHEREDLRVVVDHLRGSGTVSTLGVWGRSMGAVTGLMYQARDVELLKRMSVDSMVLDSPFSDFPELAEELVKRAESRGVYVPGLVTKMALHMLQGSIKELANFSINDLTPLKFAKDCSVPAARTTLFRRRTRRKFTRHTSGRKVSPSSMGTTIRIAIAIACRSRRHF
jgi:alpha-beta hydrolase superfamily lysophospholipase